MHIGIECLAFHRVGVKFSSALKEKEYFAMGLPIISGSPDKSTPNNCKYRHIFPSNKTIINIEKILNFAEIVYSIKDVNNKIRNYSKKNLSWNKCLEPLGSFLKIDS